MEDSRTLLVDADRESLCRLMIEMAWRLDHGHADTLFELFAVDATLVIGDQTMIGRAQIVAWGRQRARLHRLTRHVCTNMRFIRVGDMRARGSCIVTVYRHDGTGSDETEPYTVGEYVAELVREDECWRFAACRGVPYLERTDARRPT